MNSTLEALHALGGSASIAELVDKVVEIIKPTREVLEHPHTDGRQTELEYQLAWARTYLKKFGMVTNSAHGVWALTPKAHEIVTVDIAEVVKVLRAGRQPRKGNARKKDVMSPGYSRMSRTLLQRGANASCAYCSKWTPAAFERLSQRLLRESGFIEVEVTGRSGDGGIDVHSIIRIAGLISFSATCSNRSSAEPERLGRIEQRASLSLLVPDAMGANSGSVT